MTAARTDATANSVEQQHKEEGTPRGDPKPENGREAAQQLRKAERQIGKKKGHEAAQVTSKV
jgi:hypothetical protein